jgi:hypothetical protein
MLPSIDIFHPANREQAAFSQLQTLSQRWNQCLPSPPWPFSHPAHFEVISTRSLIDFDNSSLRENNDGIRALMSGLLTQAFEGGLLKRDDIANLQIEARAQVYGLARMYIDGQFPSWELGTDKPEETALSILDGYLRSMKR